MRERFKKLNHVYHNVPASWLEQWDVLGSFEDIEPVYDTYITLFVNKKTGEFARWMKDSRIISASRPVPRHDFGMWEDTFQQLLKLVNVDNNSILVEI